MVQRVHRADETDVNLKNVIKKSLMMQNNVLLLFHDKKSLLISH